MISSAIGLRGFTKILGLFLPLCAVAGIAPQSRATPAADEPILLLRRAGIEVTAFKDGERKAQLEMPAYVEVQGSPLHLQVRRSGYDQPLTLEQLQGTERPGRRELSAALLDGWRGLKDFGKLEVFDEAGQLVHEKTYTFCPNSRFSQRSDDSGPSNPSFPTACFGTREPFIRGMVWGIDQGWAAPLVRPGTRLDLEAGRYKLIASIGEGYQETFGTI